MPLIDESGTFAVEIRNPYWERFDPKDGAERLRAVLPGHLDNGQHIDGYLWATKKLLTAGTNAGKPLYEITLDTLKSLGLEGDPGHIEKLHGAEAQFVCDFEEYKGKNRLVVKFINSPRRPPMEPNDVNSILAGMGWSPDEEMAETPAAPPVESNDNDPQPANSPSGPVKEPLPF